MANQNLDRLLPAGLQGQDLQLFSEVLEDNWYKLSETDTLVKIVLPDSKYERQSENEDDNNLLHIEKLRTHSGSPLTFVEFISNVSRLHVKLDSLESFTLRVNKTALKEFLSTAEISQITSRTRFKLTSGLSDDDDDDYYIFVKEKRDEKRGRELNDDDSDDGFIVDDEEEEGGGIEGDNGTDNDELSDDETSTERVVQPKIRTKAVKRQKHIEKVKGSRTDAIADDADAADAASNFFNQDSLIFAGESAENSDVDVQGWINSFTDEVKKVPEAERAMTEVFKEMKQYLRLLGIENCFQLRVCQLKISSTNWMRFF